MIPKVTIDQSRAEAVRPQTLKDLVERYRGEASTTERRRSIRAHVAAWLEHEWRAGRLHRPQHTYVVWNEATPDRIEVLDEDGLLAFFARHFPAPLEPLGRTTASSVGEAVRLLQNGGWEVHA